MSANQLTKSTRRVRDDVYVATARLVEIERLERRGFVLHVPAEVSCLSPDLKGTDRRHLPRSPKRRK
jgi:hypothetical protein